MAQNTTSPVAQKGNRGRTLSRLVGYLMHSKLRMFIMIACGLIGVILIVAGPKIMAQGTDVLFAGILGTMLKNQMHIPDGTSMDTVVQMLQNNGQGKIASMLSNYDVQVGVGVDWTKFAQIMVLTVGIYVIAMVFRYTQTFTMSRIVADVVYRLRNDITEKINRLSLSYFDGISRGEVMSRTTNDVDNVQQSLQQMLAEFFFSVF